jgi:hypothetical protein
MTSDNDDDEEDVQKFIAGAMAKANPGIVRPSLHPVSREWLEKIHASAHRIGDIVPHTAERDLEDKGLIVRYGRGRNRKWTSRRSGRLSSGGSRNSRSRSSVMCPRLTVLVCCLRPLRSQ